MAEGVSKVEPSKSGPNQSSEYGENLECAVCLQNCVFPAQLPCGHIFCFLCIKGIANQSKRCAMCRQEIPRDYLEHPKLLKNLVKSEDIDAEGYHWFYEGRNGWWQYDERTSKELEACYKRGERTCELLIAGFLYVADMEAMLQLRRNDPSRRRRIKRDLASVPKKGIAGLRTDNEGNCGCNQRSNSVDGQTEASNPQNPANVDEDEAENPIIDDVEDALNALQSLRLNASDNDTVDDDSEHITIDYRTRGGRQRN